MLSLSNPGPFSLSSDRLGGERGCTSAGSRPESHDLPSPRVALFQPLLFTEAHRQKFQRSRRHQTVQQFKRFIENYRRHIGCVAVFYAVAAGLFLERAYCACWPRGWGPNAGTPRALGAGPA